MALTLNKYNEYLFIVDGTDRELVLHMFDTDLAEHYNITYSYDLGTGKGFLQYSCTIGASGSTIKLADEFAATALHSDLPKLPNLLNKFTKTDNSYKTIIAEFIDYISQEIVINEL